MFLRFLIPLGLAALCGAQQTATPSRIKINVIAGEGSANNSAMRVAAQPGVEVLDDNNAPVAGTEVIFQAPASGPGGTFFGATLTQTIKTDVKGQARASGFIPNDQDGKFQILVRATSGSAVAETVINQSNGQGPNQKMSSSRKGVWITVGLVAAAAVGIGVAAGRGGGSSAADTAKKPVTIGAGPITVGGPR